MERHCVTSDFSRVVLRGSLVLQGWICGGGPLNFLWFGNPQGIGWCFPFKHSWALSTYHGPEQNVARFLSVPSVHLRVWTLGSTLEKLLGWNMSDPRIFHLFQTDLIIEATLRLEYVLLEPGSLPESPVSTLWKVLGCWEFEGTKSHSKVNLL